MAVVAPQWSPERDLVWTVAEHSGISRRLCRRLFLIAPWAQVALRQAAREAAAVPGRRLALRAAPAVLEALRGLPGALEEFAAAAGQALVLRPDAAGPGDAAWVEEAKDG